MTSTIRPQLVIIAAGVSDPSSTSLLADRLADATVSAVEGADAIAPHVTRVELRELAGDIATAIVTPHRTTKLADALAAVESADAVIAVTPLYKASYSGLFKSFIDLLENDALTGTPTLLAATAGTARHSLAVDTQLRPLFGYLRADVTPSAVVATPEDWGGVVGDDESGAPLQSRIGRAAGELAARLVAAQGLAAAGSARSRRDDREQDVRRDDDLLSINFDTDLMRLATGGAA